MDYTYYFYYRPFPLDCQCNSVKQSKINSTVASKDCNNPQKDYHMIHLVYTHLQMKLCAK